LYSSNMKNETKMAKLTSAQAYALQVKADRRAAALLGLRAGWTLRAWARAHRCRRGRGARLGPPLSLGRGRHRGRRAGARTAAQGRLGAPRLAATNTIGVRACLSPGGGAQLGAQSAHASLQAQLAPPTRVVVACASAAALAHADPACNARARAPRRV
jgi:hypothetical protein